MTLIDRAKSSLDGYQARSPWVGFPLAVLKKYGDDRAGQYAGLLAYYAFLSTFPLLLVSASVLAIALKGNPALQDRVLNSSLAEFPVIGDQLRTNVHSLSGSGLALVVGVVVAFVGARGLADTAQAAFNGIWEVPYADRPGFPKSLGKSLALLLLIALGAGTTGAVAVVVGDGAIAPAVRVGLILIGLIANMALFLLGFRLATASVVRTRDLIAGAVIAATGWQILLAIGGQLVAHNLRGTSQVYGVFAAVLGLLGWFALQAQFTLYAVEVDTVRTRKLWPRALFAPPLLAADRQALTLYAEVERRVPQQVVRVELDPVSAAPSAARPGRPSGVHVRGRVSKGTVPRLWRLARVLTLLGVIAYLRGRRRSEQAPRASTGDGLEKRSG